MKVTASDAGCWIDGHWGQYGGARMVAIAAEYGWEDSEAIDLAQRHLAAMQPSDAPSLSDDEYIELSGALDDAEQFLNDYVAPDGYTFGWFDGEFFLWSDEDWQAP